MLADIFDFDLRTIVGIGGLILGLVTLIYIGGPLLTLNNLRLEAAPRLVPFEVDEYDWPREIEKLFAVSHKALDAEGFERIGGFFLPSAATSVKVALVMYVNREARDAAMATAMYGTAPDAPRSLHVEYSTRFADGRVVNTLNSRMLGSYPDREEVITNRLPSIRDARKLYGFHQAIMQESIGKAKKVLRLDTEFHGDAGAYLHDAAFRDSYEAAERVGYIRLERNGTHFVPTLKGAFLMTWRELWPWKPLRERQMLRNEKDVLARLRS